MVCVLDWVGVGVRLCLICVRLCVWLLCFVIVGYGLWVCVWLRFDVLDWLLRFGFRFVKCPFTLGLGVGWCFGLVGWFC